MSKLLYTRSAKTEAQLAWADFAEARRKALWRDWVSLLTGKSNHLLTLGHVSNQWTKQGQSYRGAQTVQIDQIVGTIGRYIDFDRAFLPRHNHIKSRWVSINQAYYNDIPLPPVELIKVRDMYFVIDGHHRISVARTHGQQFIDALVTEVSTSEPACESKMMIRSKRGLKKLVPILQFVTG